MNQTDSPIFEVRALTRRVRMSSHKVRKVADQIRNCSYDKALRLLRRMRYGACSPVLKLLNSASANARERLGTSKRRLWISQLQVDERPVLKRIRPRAQGRGYSIQKPSCSITLLVKPTDRAALVTRNKRPKRKWKRRQPDMSSAQPHHSAQKMPVTSKRPFRGFGPDPNISPAQPHHSTQKMPITSKRPFRGFGKKTD